MNLKAQGDNNYTKTNNVIDNLQKFAEKVSKEIAK